ncbi:MAG: hypothetical protein IT167_29510 [Bryobacterales bacterium]|nr:hypothetical protein [Bryobacterales bacterium]
MLPTNYDSIAAERPSLAPILRDIAAWARSHADWGLIDPRVLSKDLLHVDPVRLSAALDALVDAGVLQQVFMVALPPTGYLAYGRYHSVDEIPDRVYDRSERLVDTADADIVAVLTAPE